MDWDQQVEIRHRETSVKWFTRLIQTRSQIPNWISTSFRNGQHCQILDNHHGSFNWGLSLRFDDDVEWLVRFAVPGRVMDCDGKIAREVAISQLVKGSTNIPIPTIHAWGLSKDNPLGLGPFIVMDFIRGESLGKLWEQKVDNEWTLRPDISLGDLRTVYRQIARFLIELSALRFPCVGSPAVGLKGPAGPLTLKMQEIEAHSGVKAGGGSLKSFTCATDYFYSVVEQDIEHLRQQPNSVDDYHDACAKYEFLHQLKTLVPCLVTNRHNYTEFRLICDDMRLGNMLVNKDLKIVAVLDWEWAYFGPYQMFYSAPCWLFIKRSARWNEGDLPEFQAYLELFTDELAKEERARGLDGAERLSTLMRQSISSGQLWFHELICSCYNGPDNPAWTRLKESFRNSLLPVQESEKHIFAAAKLEQLESYNRIWQESKTKIDQKEKEKEKERGVPLTVIL